MLSTNRYKGAIVQVVWWAVDNTAPSQALQKTLVTKLKFDIWGEVLDATVMITQAIKSAAPAAGQVSE